MKVFRLVLLLNSYYLLNDFSALSAVLVLALEATFFAGLRVVFFGTALESALLSVLVATSTGFVATTSTGFVATSTGFVATSTGFVATSTGFDSDLNRLRSDLNRLRSDLNRLRSDLNRIRSLHHLAFG